MNRTPKLVQQPAVPRSTARRQVFVAYPYRLYPKSDYRKIYKEIEQSYEVTFIFADEKITNMHIMKKIESFIRSSDFAVFDISGWNPNVTLELGFAMALNDQWYIAINPEKTEAREVPSDLRGLDRIQYASYTELKEHLQTIMAQRYPKRAAGTIDAYLTDQRSETLQLLRREPGLNISSIAQLLGVEVQVTQLVVRPLVEQKILRTEGSRKGTRYYVTDLDRPVSGRQKARDERPSPRAASPIPGLNTKEALVLDSLRLRQAATSLEDLAVACFPEESEVRAGSWVRNSLRKLVARKLAKKVSRGLYRSV